MSPFVQGFTQHVTLGVPQHLIDDDVFAWCEAQTRQRQAASPRTIAKNGSRRKRKDATREAAKGNGRRGVQLTFRIVPLV